MLRSPRLWIGTGLIAAVVSILFALLYVGGNVNPRGNLHDLPVAVVNGDTGAKVNGRQILGISSSWIVAVSCWRVQFTDGCGSRVPGRAHR
ncbi:hypothetical protein ACM614_19995, partial [Streptomyces sp. 12297]